ncbi:MAG: SDR family NAD(P)-dependent oxidoreductase [Saprospiraceae bacterium]|nr:SDR family NAD(P)-dependent oxidoreductase [Saprospiraceae bacterium]
MQKGAKEKPLQPPQTQHKQPGIEAKMYPPPEFMGKTAGSDRLEGQVAIITGGDSGIGRAVAVAFAKEGSDTPLGWAVQPEEVATCQVFLASDDASCITGQVMRPNGGEIVPCGQARLF